MASCQAAKFTSTCRGSLGSRGTTNLTEPISRRRERLRRSVLKSVSLQSELEVIA